MLINKDIDAPIREKPVRRDGEFGVKTLIPAAVGSFLTKAEPSRKSWII
jgi:hypothetical protein